MNYYEAIFDNTGAEYFKTYEGNANKVKRFAIKSASIHLNIWNNANTTPKEQTKHLTTFKVLTEDEYNMAVC